MVVHHLEGKQINIRLDVHIQADIYLLTFKSHDYVVSFSLKLDNLDPNIDSFMDLGTQFRNKLLTCLYINKVQCRLPVGVTERQPQIAVDAHYICLVDERQRKAVAAGNLVSVADRCQMFVVVPLLIGLKVNAVQCPAPQLTARLQMSDKLQVHSCRFMISNCRFPNPTAKIRGFESKVLVNFTSCAFSGQLFAGFALCSCQIRQLNGNRGP